MSDTRSLQLPFKACKQTGTSLSNSRWTAGIFFVLGLCYPETKGTFATQGFCFSPHSLYCDGTNNQAPSGPCEPGYFCTGGAKSALQQVVMEGHYSLTGAFKPEPCPLGSFQPVSMLVYNV